MGWGPCPPALTWKRPSWLRPLATRPRRSCFFQMGMEIIGWHIGLREPRAPSPSWAAAEGPGGARSVAPHKWLSLQMLRKGALKTQGLTS